MIMSVKYSSGFIFVTVLIFLNLFSLLSIYSFMQLSEALKKNDHFFQNKRDSIEIYKILKLIETQRVQGIGGCIIPITPAMELAMKPISWWQLNTCSDNVSGIRYYYAVELLGNANCAFIKKVINNQLISVKYERITLYALADKITGAKYRIQSTIAIPNDEISSCNTKPRWVHEGRQMWREL
jgi:hypothetical protein